jgi:hypothetical protein
VAQVRTKPSENNAQNGLSVGNDAFGINECTFDDLYAEQPIERGGVGEEIADIAGDVVGNVIGEIANTAREVGGEVVGVVGDVANTAKEVGGEVIDTIGDVD